MGDWLIDNVMGPFMLLLFGAMIAVLGWLIWDAATAETFSLRKDGWRCTKSHNELVMAGKVPVMTEVCDIWERK